jgi:hypothetical protein
MTLWVLRFFLFPHELNGFQGANFATQPRARVLCARELHSSGDFSIPATTNEI